MDIRNISKEKLQFVEGGLQLHDQKFETKPIGFLKDAWLRFKKNKGSIVAAIIILIIILFAVFGPVFSSYAVSDCDANYALCRPDLGLDLPFWNGDKEMRLNDNYLALLYGIGYAAEDPDGSGNVAWQQAVDSEYACIVNTKDSLMESGTHYTYCDVDTVMRVGFSYQTITMDEYNAIRDWENTSGIRVIYPMIDYDSEFCMDSDDANCWYKSMGKVPLTKDGNRATLEYLQVNGYADNYKRDAEGNVVYYVNKDKTMISVRVLYYNYYRYLHEGSRPTHIFGTDGQGYDIFIRLASGARISLLLAFGVSIINLTIGAFYGAIEGYYGGVTDMIMERITDILADVPFIIVATLFQQHFVQTGKVSAFTGLLFAFVLTGWIGTAYRVRTQFYRFKNQEYVLAARTLGASDMRIMWKHIFPNSLGTIITSSVLVIPGVIFSESMLSFLGIVNFQSKDMTSIGTLLSNGQKYLSTDPHVIFFPAMVISLLMISFNLFGNGLRDAFNPSLRGTEE
ncbi:MAG: ABC transporter permease [Clostridia bacterium]|nr:ABC transporter permease [Clostridia bacterium]MBO7665850.1 ABC transporter permease [Clostridia bacterium]MBP5238724.1 ABC transporter permease [Clostridia bacterium]